VTLFNKKIYKNDIKKSCSAVDINAFKFFRGTKKSTNFPDHSFKKIFIGLSVHEFEFKKEMLQDIKRIMQPDAKLYIMEP
ncbi:methyltransferase domain-containing protein, partial [Acinetobacter baumannii]